MTHAAHKAELRHQLLAWRQAQDDQPSELASTAAVKHLVSHPQFKQSGAVGAYCSVRGELDTSALLQAVWVGGKVLYLPMLMGAEKVMRFGRHEVGQSLAHGRYGIPQPADDVPQTVGLLGIDLLVLPLVGFDALGGRLGYGGGYYDQTLANSRQRPFLLGLAFEGQRVEKLPQEPHDIALDAVVTECGWYSFDAAE
ncbi:5-formyltetrahydrofolate cyclo-ligase [Magnetococcus sp. PR-3]|uniref:5-formyltetrahydrofolate cyclo-ligase n=1 Tax=Magnetococcus sp. PR-3 TaxID=3120355 RepID=UPI002FCE4E21